MRATLILAALPLVFSSFVHGQTNTTSTSASRLQARPVCSDAPADTNTLSWSTASGCWKPASAVTDTNTGTVLSSSSFSTAVAQSQTVYAYPSMIDAWATSERTWTMPASCTLQKFYAFMVAAPGGSNQSVTFTVRANTQDTGITCSIATGANPPTCNDVSHTAAITAGQPLSVKVVMSATTGNVNPGFALLCK